MLQTTIQDRRLKSEVALDFNLSQSTSWLRPACRTGAGDRIPQDCSGLGDRRRLLPGIMVLRSAPSEQVGASHNLIQSLEPSL